MRILLVDATQAGVSHLSPLLVLAGLSQVGERIGVGQAIAGIDRYQPDVVIVDIDSMYPGLWSCLNKLLRHNPRPTLLLCAQEHPELVQAAFQQGMSAYTVPKPTPELLRSLVMNALCNFGHFQQSTAAAAQSKRSPEERRVIDRARRLIMEHYHLSEREAYACLRRLAMDRRQRLADTALALLSLAAA